MRKTLIAMLALAALGLAGSANAQTVVSSDITTDTTWSGTVILTQPIFVKSDAVLTILPGTIVRGQPRSAAPSPGVTAGTPGALIVTQSGKINAVGTPSAPIVMTTAAVDRNSDGIADRTGGNGSNTFLELWTAPDGLTNFIDDAPLTEPMAPLDATGRAHVAMWGGLVVLGDAPTNLDDVQGLGVGKATVEGLTVPGFPDADATYGGFNAWDSSGKLSYISVRHAGDEIGSGNELNGVTLGGVGAGTQFDHIEVYANFDDGIEWFGGTVNGMYLHVVAVGDDSFDVDQGYSGFNQFLLNVSSFFDQRVDIIPDTNNPDEFGSDSGDKVAEWDGDDCPDCELDTEGNARPTPSACFYNLTSFGTSANSDTAGTAAEWVDPQPNAAETAIVMRAGFGGGLFNSIITNSGGGCDLAGSLTAQGLVSIVSNTFVDVGGSGCDATQEANGDALSDMNIGAGPGTFDYNCSVNASSPNTTPGAFGGFVNEDTSFDPTGSTALGSGTAVPGKLNSSLKSAPIDPRPTGVLCTSGATEAFGKGLVNVTYRGAFDPGAVELWTTDWTVLNIAGLLAD